MFFRPPRVISRYVNRKFVFRTDFNYGNNKEYYYKNYKPRPYGVTRVFIHVVNVLEQRKRAGKHKRAYRADDKRKKSLRLFLIGFRSVFVFVFEYGYLFFIFVFFLIFCHSIP